jgi:hypothetical protein
MYSYYWYRYPADTLYHTRMREYFSRFPDLTNLKVWVKPRGLVYHYDVKFPGLHPDEFQNPFTGCPMEAVGAVSHLDLHGRNASSFNRYADTSAPKMWAFAMEQLFRAAQGTAETNKDFAIEVELRVHNGLAHENSY